MTFLLLPHIFCLSFSPSTHLFACLLMSTPIPMSHLLLISMSHNLPNSLPPSTLIV